MTDQLKIVFPKALLIKTLLLDVDGVLTNGNLTYSADGMESKQFNTQDGFGLRVLQEAGIDIGIITARKSDIVERRARELNIKFLYQGAKNKLVAFKEISAKSGYKPIEFAYMGDDWLDLVLLNRVGLSIAPANGVDEVKKVAHIVTKRKGGEGAVREACDLILKAKGLYEPLLQKYSG